MPGGVLLGADGLGKKYRLSITPTCGAAKPPRHLMAARPLAFEAALPGTQG